MRNWKKKVKAFVPSIFLETYQNFRAGKHLVGHFASWSEAVASSSGYGTEEIFKRTVAAMREVTAGRAAFSRDGVAFHEAAMPYHILFALTRHAARAGGRLRVLDFGGSLGNIFYQCRPALKGLSDVKWLVVEREDLVAAGRREFTQPGLSFHSSIDEISSDAPDVVLFGSVLQYLERPYEVLSRILQFQPATVVIDRTPFSRSGEEFVTVQNVPEEIYPASYPSWIFSEKKILAQFGDGYELLTRIEPVEELDPAVEYRGLIMIRKP